MSGLQADICLVQHGLPTCGWSLQPEVDATDKPIAGSGAGTASSLIKQVASPRFQGPRCSTPCFCHGSPCAIAAVPFTLQLGQLPCNQRCKSNGPFCIDCGSLILQQSQNRNEDVLLPESKKVVSKQNKRATKSRRQYIYV